MTAKGSFGTVYPRLKSFQKQVNLTRSSTQLIRRNFGRFQPRHFLIKRLEHTKFIRSTYVQSTIYNEFFQLSISTAAVCNVRYGVILLFSHFYLYTHGSGQLTQLTHSESLLLNVNAFHMINGTTLFTFFSSCLHKSTFCFQSWSKGCISETSPRVTFRV